MIENIDIGGPTMIRAAAKNFALRGGGGRARELRRGPRGAARRRRPRSRSATRESLAAEAFAYTARYDTAISRWFAEKQDDFPPLFVRAYEKVTDLAYGENPHQRAAYYAAGRRAHARALDGRASSTARSCRSTTCSTSTPRALLIAGVRAARPARSSSTTTRAAWPSAGSALEAYERAFACDPLSAFGGVICVNRPVDGELAEALCKQFVEVLFAPGFADDALEVLAAKPNMRILEDDERRRVNVAERDIKRVIGGLLVQDRDLDLEDRAEMEVVTERKPTEARVGRDAVRLEGLQARALERDRARPRTSRRSGSAPAR